MTEQLHRTSKFPTRRDRVVASGFSEAKLGCLHEVMAGYPRGFACKRAETRPLHRHIIEEEVEKMKYIDGFVLVVPENNLPAYRKMAEEAGNIWKKHGALEYIESVGEDLNPDVPPEMKGVTFPQMAGVKADETVIFSYILFNSRQHRDEVNAKVMKEMEAEMNRPENKDKPMPFDMKRAAYGGFEVIVEA